MANKISLLYLLVLLSLARNTPAEANTSACQLTFDPSIDLRQRYVITWAFSELRCVAGQCDPGSIAVNLGTSNIAIIDIENKKSTIGVPFKETKETPILRDLARVTHIPAKRGAWRVLELPQGEPLSNLI